MGFSPGEFENYYGEYANTELHWEGRRDYIMLWSANELNLILGLDRVNARKALDQLTLLVEMLEGDRL